MGEVFLEDYTLLDELGQGGYATVYKVRHNVLGYIRAIRVLNATITNKKDPTYIKFLDECKLLLRLGNGNHPNIVHIYQPLLKDSKALVEMDYVDGKDVLHYLEDNDLFVDISDVLKLLTDIGSALSYCHEEIYRFCMNKDVDDLQDDPDDGSKVLLDDKTKKELIKKYRVIHNDIHSGNIMRRENGSYVLLDFGLAIEGDSVIRSSRRRNGAPEFKAPEKWDNEATLSTQSDIYSFGVVLYEFLAGRVPFQFDKKNSNSVEAEYLLGQAHKHQQPEPIYELRKDAFERTHPNEEYIKDYPDWLETLIMKCLSKKAEDRFENGRELYQYVLANTEPDTSVYAQKLRNDITTLEETIEEQKTEINTLNELVEKYRNNEQVQPQFEDNEYIKGIKAENDDLKTEKEKLKEEIAGIKEDNLKLTNDVNRLQNNRNGVNSIWKYISIILLIASVTYVGYLLKQDAPARVSTNFENTIPDINIGREDPKSLYLDSLVKVSDELKETKKSFTSQQDIDKVNQQIKEIDNEIKVLQGQAGNENADAANSAEEFNPSIVRGIGNAIDNF